VVGACLTAQWSAVRLPWAAPWDRLEHPTACLTARVAAQCWALSTACKCGRLSPEVRSHRRPRAPRRVPHCPCSDVACLGARRPVADRAPRPHAAHRSGRAVGGRALTRGRGRARARRRGGHLHRDHRPPVLGAELRHRARRAVVLAHRHPLVRAWLNLALVLPTRRLSAWVTPPIIVLWWMSGSCSASAPPPRLQRACPRANAAHDLPHTPSSLLRTWLLRLRCCRVLRAACPVCPFIFANCMHAPR